MEIISEAVGLDDAPQEPLQEPQEPLQEPQEPPQEPPKRRAHRATSKAPKVRYAPAPEPEPEPEPEQEPEPPTPKARARPTTARAARAAPPAPAPAGIGDVLNMLASALLDQRQARTARRQEMYSRFLD